MELFTISPDFDLNWIDWLLILFAALIVGLAKAGIKGIGIFFVTIMALVFGGKASTGIVMPLLVVGDIFAVVYYNRHTQWRYLRHLLPWMILGVLLGVWIGKDLPEELFKKAMAFIILSTVGMMFWWEKRKIQYIPDNWWFAGIMGMTAGFTTMIGNLAGPIANIFFLAMRLPKNDFIGTAAWLFFIINLFKIPFHVFVWRTINPETLAVNLRLIPAIALGLFAGVYLVKLIREAHYRHLILLLTALGAVIIMFK